MKRILFIAGIIAFTSNMALAQGTATTKPAATNMQATEQQHAPAFSKADLTAKVGELKAALNSGNAAAAQAKWNEVNKVMIGALGMSKYHLLNDGEASKAANTDALINQRNIYAQIAKLKNDLIGNKAALSSKLDEFAATTH
jgi:hypothetical protein